MPARETPGVGILRWIVIAALLAGGSVWGSVTDAFLDGAGVVSRAAERGVQVAVDADCDLTTVAALAGRHPGVDQFVLMTTAEFGATSGTVAVAVRAGSGWACQTDARFAMFGRSGTSPLVERVSGDGTTPAGVFPLGRVTAWDGQVFSLFGNRPDPGAVAPYRAVRHADCWGATPHTARYQHLVEQPRCSGPDEWLPSYGDAYAHAAVIGANLDPISGDAPGETPYAAAIFLHRHSYLASGPAKPTSGCVSLAYEDLLDVVRLLDPRLDPHFAIGPVDWLRQDG
jgi:L,D-peptidoglycan transpeptidase YkuD (ErfK/YbiS/YcfS/YnhG family)